MLLRAYGNTCFGTKYTRGLVRRVSSMVYETDCVSTYSTVAILRYSVRTVGSSERPAANEKERMPKGSASMQPRLIGNSATHSESRAKSATPSFCDYR